MGVENDLHGEVKVCRICQRLLWPGEHAVGGMCSRECFRIHWGRVSNRDLLDRIQDFCVLLALQWQNSQRLEAEQRALEEGPHRVNSSTHNMYQYQIVLDTTHEERDRKREMSSCRNSRCFSNGGGTYLYTHALE